MLRSDKAGVETIGGFPEYSLNVWVTNFDGRTGITLSDIHEPSIKVQYGPDGPIELTSIENLRFATHDEIAEKTGEVAP